MLFGYAQINWNIQMFFWLFTQLYALGPLLTSTQADYSIIRKLKLLLYNICIERSAVARSLEYLEMLDGLQAIP